MKFLLDDTSAGGIAKVVDTIYKKGVYDAVEEKNAPYTKAFAEENNDYKRFQFLDNPRPVSIISFKDRILVECAETRGTFRILREIRRADTKSGFGFAICILCNYFYCKGLEEGSNRQSSDQLEVFMKKRYMNWETKKTPYLDMYLDYVKYICNTLSETLPYPNTMFKLSVLIGKALYDCKTKIKL